MKLTLNSVGSLIDATTAQATINANNTLITTAMENTLSRDGITPDTMSSNLDMNSNQIINLPAPATTGSPLRLSDLQSFTGSGTISLLPTGGTTGQGLKKNSNTNYDVSFGNVVSSVGLALPSDFTVTGSPITGSGTLTGTWVSTPTGTGAVVRATSPTIATPSLTTPTITGHPTVEGVTSTGATGTGKFVFDTFPTIQQPTLTQQLTMTGSTSGSTVLKSTAIAAGTVTIPAVTDTLIGKATTDTLTNKTFNSTGTGNVMQVSGVTVSSGQYPGEPTTGSATAGNVGEFISSTVLVGAAVSLTNGTATNITSISLTAGDWDVCGNAIFLPAGTTTVNSIAAWTSTTSATFPTAPNNGALTKIQASLSTGLDQALTVGSQRISISGTTTVFLSVFPGFAVSTMTGYGFLRARRVR